MNELLKLIQKQWHKPLGLGAVAFLIVLIGVGLVRYLALPPNFTGWACLGVFAIAAWQWHVHRSIPKNPRNKLGFLVAIHCTDEKQQLQVRQDFVEHLRGLIKGDAATSKFNFIEVPDRLSGASLDVDEMERTRKKTNAHFAIFGRVRLRDFGGKPHHVIDIRGVVAHREVDKSVQEQFAKEFAELLPQRIQFPEENDLLAFEFTAELADVVSRYVIGLAAALSGDVDYAEKMYAGVSAQLAKVSRKFLVLEKIRNRLPFRMFELNEARAMAAYGRWRKDKTPAHAEELGRHLSKIPDEPYATRILGLRAVHAVIAQWDIKRAREITLRHNTPENAIWHFNLAFLDAYDGKLRKAIEHYRNGSRAVVEEPVLADIEEFMNWVLKERPQKYQFYYCLGFFNWKVRGDLRLAKRDFTTFLSSASVNDFPGEQRLARKWLGEIEGELNRASPADGVQAA